MLQQLVVKLFVIKSKWHTKNVGHIGILGGCDVVVSLKWFCFSASLTLALIFRLFHLNVDQLCDMTVDWQGARPTGRWQFAITFLIIFNEGVYVIWFVYLFFHTIFFLLTSRSPKMSLILFMTNYLMAFN